MNFMSSQMWQLTGRQPIRCGSQTTQHVQNIDGDLVYVRTFGTTGVPYLTDGYHYFGPVVSIDLDQNILISESIGYR